ncbi:MAG: hypothetical protein CML20_17105 [Rheinheimera sp.]|uniref:hypothetical protein n=1 Tax=Arsukibacterium sp. UBA3155 TaxID=1946058 RepID=UPI000C8C5FB6|nr:hypothetical protein [Arsukibacterium sp. UBA3155]MAD76478.1 hypothetical protein [Rheinheimera sp.]|tara:strand:+ start:124131 stop:124724 length:594 start_codon:yes stop_codon:yes gene_type:complete
MEDEVMEKTITVYRLKPVANSYEVPELDLFGFADILGDDDLSLVRRQPRTNESLLDKWTPSRCELAPEYQQGLTVPDVSFWGSYLLLSEEAYNAFKTLLVDVGEFLALQVGYMQMYIFVPLHFAQEDTSKTLRHYEDGFECGVETLVFEQSSLADKPVFKSEMYGTHGLFVTDKFKVIYVKHNFTGVEFDEHLAGIF